MTFLLPFLFMDKPFTTYSDRNANSQARFASSDFINAGPGKDIPDALLAQQHKHFLDAGTNAQATAAAPARSEDLARASLEQLWFLNERLAVLRYRLFGDESKDSPNGLDAAPLHYILQQIDVQTVRANEQLASIFDRL